MNLQILLRKCWVSVKNKIVYPSLGRVMPLVKVDVRFSDFYYLDSHASHCGMNDRKGTYFIEVTNNQVLSCSSCSVGRKTLAKEIQENSGSIAHIHLITEEVEKVKKELLASMIGIYHHELGHARCTDFAYWSKTIEELLDDEIQRIKIPALKAIFNVLEDVFVDAYVRKHFPLAGSCMKFVLKRLCEVPDIEPSTDAVMDFVRMLLCKAKMGIKPPVINLYEKHKERIDEAVFSFYKSSSNSRVDSVFNILDVLLDVGFKLPEKEDEQPGDLPGHVEHEGKKGAPGDKHAVSPVGDRPFSTEPVDTLEEDVILEGIADNVDDTYYSHELVDLRDYCSFDADRIDDVIDNYDALISECVDEVRKIETMNYVYPELGHKSGRLNVGAYARSGCSLGSSLEKKCGEDRTPDLYFYLLVDNSGSMCGVRSTLASYGAIALSEMLSRLGIPFEVGAFTESACVCLTYVVKSDDASFESCKGNFQILNQSWQDSFLVGGRCEYNTFAGNVDEKNLEFVHEKVKARQEADRIVIVLSDGQTTGSECKLKSVVEDIERDGISCLGIGLQTDYVPRIYPKHIILSSDSDLERLPEFLNEFVVNLYKGE